MKEHLNFKEMTKRNSELSKVTIKCDCGHSVTIINKHKRLICSWCGRYVYLDPKDEFKDKLERSMKKVENE